AFIRVQEPEIRLNVPAGGCIPFSYTPRAVITTLDTVATYTWDLGDGTIVTGREPAPHLYTVAGVYPVSLTITTVSGCTKTVTVPDAIRTGTPPVPAFSFAPANACADEVISFTNTSTTTPGAEVIWNWDFGDGGTSGLQNPTHVFTDTGLLTVRLSVSNNRCVRFIEQDVYVQPPVARFDFAFDCTVREATFTNRSLFNPAIAPLAFSWDFGNGQTSTDENPGPVPYTPGTYNVQLTVTNGLCDYMVSRSITIGNEPADFQVSSGPACRNNPVTFTAINSNPANVADYAWEANGVPIGSGRVLNHSFAANGNYDVVLRITDLNGCVTISAPTRVAVGGPAAEFEPVMAGACLNKTATFRDLSTSALPITNWTFDFGDGTVQSFSAAPFTHIYTSQGTFDVSMTITDAAGCRDTYTLPFSLLVTDPKVGFRADTFYCPQAPLQFADTSVGVGLTYLWEFGDGTTSTQANPLHAYPAGDADYAVKLKITDIAGCSDSVTKAAYIKIRSPQAAFDIRDTVTICPPLRTSFTFQGSDYSSFYWSFGDGGRSTLENPSYFYGAYGTFTPKLYVFGNGGCVDSAQSSVTVHDPDDIRINYGPVTTACNSLNVDFELVVPDGFPFIFYFGDGTADSSGNTTLSHFYSRPSFSRPYLVLRDPVSGCEILVNGATRIEVLGAIPLFGMDRDAFCDNGNVTFTNYTTRNEPIISQLWTFGDGGTSADDAPVHNYTQPGLYPVTLNITTQSNCTSSYTDTVLVYRTPSPVITGRDTICLNVAEPYMASLAVADTLTNWQWNFGNGQTANNANSSVTYQASGDYTITLTATNLIGCRSTATRTV
ncbi:MAG TPA: PKD domain-containing protein, partial [Chitinophagaceae bacterium]|nr:PKD domain-containing protein [Chitinophagaceae bacterium]